MRYNIKGHPVQAGYALVKIGGQRQFMKIRRETPRLVTGLRVNRDGSVYERESGIAIQTFLVAVTPAEVVKRMQLNLHYEELEDEEIS